MTTSHIATPPTLVWARDPRPTRETFRPGAYYIRRPGMIETTWICQWIQTIDGFDTMVSPGWEWCYIPRPITPKPVDQGC